MRNKLFSLMFVLAISLTAFAQTSLKGRVIDETTMTPVVGAKVTLANQNISTTTNAAGEFSLLYLEATDEEVLIEADGYLAALELINLQADQANQMDDVALQQDIVVQAQDEILLNLTEEEMTDDEGRSQSQASSSSASTDVFNSNTSFAWSTARYRNRGYQSNVENYYIEGLNFSS
ncbi:MAG: carboxypeptidase regulatory-like domain-containing protein, partial [Paludibacteraceae bacterium]|nr:carboxypeptidase regulatory-like domain-containing protein [Paludibacteraceae bacterium]